MQTMQTIVYGRCPKYLDSFETEKTLMQICYEHKVHKPELRLDRKYLDVKKDAIELRKIHKELKQNPRSIRLILPTRIIEWYRGSLTNLVTILHDLKQLVSNESLLTVNSEQIYQYLRDWKHEQALQTDYLIRKQGRTVGRPKKDVAIETILDMACDGQSVSRIAAHYQVSRMLIWRRIRGVFESTDIYLKNKAKLAEQRLLESDPLKDRRVSISKGKLKAKGKFGGRKVIEGKVKWRDDNLHL